jgi:aspartyl-tRNA(Asn)/glutamyl-tRNA(Gln) amidotransferase subunit C
VFEMADITKERINKIADSVRIAITDEEAEIYTDQINSIITYANILSELNTDDVEPTTHGIVLGNVLRKDEPKQLIKQEDALENAPDQEDGHFKVPSIME